MPAYPKITLREAKWEMPKDVTPIHHVNMHVNIEQIGSRCVDVLFKQEQTAASPLRID